MKMLLETPQPGPPAPEEPEPPDPEEGPTS